MIYLYCHADPRAEIACAECEDSAAKLEARGFVRCTAALHRVLWQQRDRATLRELRSAIKPISTQPAAVTLANGWTRYTT